MPGEPPARTSFRGTRLTPSDDRQHATRTLLILGVAALTFARADHGHPGDPRAHARTLAAGGALTGTGLGLLAAAHGSQAQVVVVGMVMSAGIGLAFAAMPNLIIDAVPARQTGEATGFNALVRSVGSSLGSQVSATILAASAVAGIPTDQGFTDAFGVSAVVAACAGVVALRIPRAPESVYAPTLQEFGAASPLGEPAFSVKDS